MKRIEWLGLGHNSAREERAEDWFAGCTGENARKGPARGAVYSSRDLIEAQVFGIPGGEVTAIGRKG